MNGYLLVNKPSGISSFKALKIVQKKLNIKKIGHCGTLDPLATGMLPVMINEGTKYAQYISSQDKCYEVTGEFGYISTTYDIDGDVSPIEPSIELNPDLINEHLTSFMGEISQTPPNFSAIKINGERAYTLARKGVDFKLKARNVHINKFKIISIEKNKVTFNIECSKGTYVRSLIHDLGQKIGCGAVVTALHRTWVSPFNLNSMTPIEEVNQSDIQDLKLLFKQHIQLNSVQKKSIEQGKVINIEPHNQSDAESIIGLLDENNCFFGTAIISDGLLKAKRIFSHKNTAKT